MIPLMKHAFLNERETREALSQFVLRAERFSMSSECLSFERKFAAHQVVAEAILFNSGGSANLALLQALKNLGRLKSGDMIGFSALTWSTNVMPIIQLGFEPIPIDCDPGTLNVMVRDLKETLERFPLKAIFLTNVLGFLGDLTEIKELCNERGVI